MLLIELKEKISDSFELNTLVRNKISVNGFSIDKSFRINKNILTYKLFRPSKLVGPAPGLGNDTDGYTPKACI